MGGFSLKKMTFVMVFVLLMWFESCNARRVGGHKSRNAAVSLSKKKGNNNHHHKGNVGKSRKKNPKAPPPLPPPPMKGGNVFNVLDFGAKGDGNNDDTQAFQASWAAACKIEASVIIIPAQYVFLVGPISFSGRNCQHNTIFQLDGTIVAPTGSTYLGSGPNNWLEFRELFGLTIKGSGTIDGNGAVWWQMSPRKKPTALRFYKGYNVTVSGITIKNSAQCHLKFNNCNGVLVFNFTVSSPGDSPNTDAIHLQNSHNVLIRNSNLACGDDCVSIQTGCTNVYIHNINCGPGHGISIGGLGRDNTRACVSNITVRDIFMHNTMTGVRIKTWQGGSGWVKGVQFSNIEVSEVERPIVIDQYYCDKGSCENQTSAVALSGINYENIRGTYTVKPVHFACSDNLPCTDVTLTNVELKPQKKERARLYEPFCWKTFGQLYTPTVPPIECLLVGKPSSNKIQGDISDHC